MLYTLPGDPVPWKRPQLSGKNFFDGQYALKERARILLANMFELPPHEQPLFLDITFFMKMPEKKKTDLHSPHYRRPDLDNLLKYFLDAATGILFKDDSIVTSFMASKVYGTEPRTEFMLTPMKDLPKQQIEYLTNIEWATEEESHYKCEGCYGKQV